MPQEPPLKGCKGKLPLAREASCSAHDGTRPLIARAGRTTLLRDGTRGVRGSPRGGGGNESRRVALAPARLVPRRFDGGAAIVACWSRCCACWCGCAAYARCGTFGTLGGCCCCAGPLCFRALRDDLAYVRI